MYVHYTYAHRHMRCSLTDISIVFINKMIKCRGIGYKAEKQRIDITGVHGIYLSSIWHWDGPLIRSTTREILLLCSFPFHILFVFICVWNGILSWSGTIQCQWLSVDCGNKIYAQNGTDSHTQTHIHCLQLRRRNNSAFTSNNHKLLTYFSIFIFVAKKKILINKYLKMKFHLSKSLGERCLWIRFVIIVVTHTYNIQRMLR